MPRRILICIQDTGVAHVVAARLMKDGADGVVVEKPDGLVEEARSGAEALVVQDKYPTGEAGASLLRQVRVARGEVVPGVFLLTSELAAPDRHVLEKQYKIREFLQSEASPHKIATALLDATGADDDADLVLHEDEVKNDFDIEIDSHATELHAVDLKDFDDDSGARTVEFSLAQLDELKKKQDPAAKLPTRKVHDEVTRGNPLMQQAVTKAGEAIESLEKGVLTQEGASADLADGATLSSDLEGAETGVIDFTMPAPGASRDLELPIEVDDSDAPKTVASGAAVTEAVPAEILGLDLGDGKAGDTSDGDAEPEETKAKGSSEKSGEPDDSDEEDFRDLLESKSPLTGEDEMQNQELKKALLAKKRQLEQATKRIDELEGRVKEMADAQAQEPGEALPKEGVFEDIRYPVLLSRCRAEAWTGAINMQLAGGITRTIFVRNGLPMSFKTSEPGDKIGKVLVSQGRIDDAQYTKAATRMVERGIKLSEALVDLGLIDAETLEVEIRNLTRDQIIAGFELTKGRFTLDEGQEPDGDIPTFDFGPGEVYVQGYRQYAPDTEMQGLYEQLRPKYLIANSRLASFRPKLGLGGDDERLLRFLGEAYTVEEAVERAGINADHAARLIAALQALDLVEEWNPGVEQFLARLQSERQHFADEMAKVHASYARREEQLIKNFEQALSKISTAVSSGGDSGAALKDGLKEVKSPDIAKPMASKPSMPAADVSPATPAVAPAAPSASKGETITVPEPKPAPPPKKEEPPLPADEPTVVGSAAEIPAVESTPGNGAPKGGGIKLADIPDGDPPTPADAKFREAVKLATEDRLDEAEVTLREAVRMDASRPDFLTSLARVLLANPRYERAGTLPVVRSLLDRAVQLSPEHPEASQLHKEIIDEMGG